jgi:hypothetical protein
VRPSNLPGRLHRLSPYVWRRQIPGPLDAVSPQRDTADVNTPARAQPMAICRPIVLIAMTKARLVHRRVDGSTA